MKTILSSRRHQHLAMASIFLVTVALIAGMVGCNGDDNGGVVEYSLTISSTSGGSASTPGEGTFTYDEGTVVQLVATPDAGYAFNEWTGDVGAIADINANTTNITMNDHYSITANFEYIPLSVPSEWDRVPTPTTEGWVVAPESMIIDAAYAEGGEVAYAVVYAFDESPCEDSWTSNDYYLLKSDDYAATWEDFTDALDDVDESYGIQEIMRVATDWVAPDFVAVALMEDDEIRVYFSADGGSSFEDVDGEVLDNSVYFAGPADVADLAVSYEYNGARDIAIGGVGNDTYAALFRCTVVGEFNTGWEDATEYDGWDGDISLPINPTSELVTDIIFSSSWGSDKTILVTTVDLYTAWDAPIELGTVHLQCGSWSTSPGWNEDSTLGIDAVPILEDVDLPMWLVNFDGRLMAGMTLPEDYNSDIASDRILWVWVNYYEGGIIPLCSLMRVEDDSADLVGPMGQIDDGELWLTNISYHGTIAEGEAIAGILGDGMGDYNLCCEGVQVYHNGGIRNMDICCERWHDACKPPTGRNAMGVAYVDDDKAYAVALQGDLYNDEGAWSVTFDDGDTWNQLSLIDTWTDYFLDVAVSPDCNKAFLVSVFEPWDGECDCDSIWLHAVNLPEAPEYSGKWLRTWCGMLEEDWGLLRLAPEETTGDTVVLVDFDTINVYMNDLETLACWDPIWSTELDYIVDLALQDADTLFGLDEFGEVAMFDDDEWQEAVDGKVDEGFTIAVWDEHVLVGGSGGEVSYSEDNGETFDLLEDIPSIEGWVTVAFDTYFDTNGVVYGATDEDDYTGGIYQWVIGESEEWQDLNAVPEEWQVLPEAMWTTIEGTAEVEVTFTGLVVDRPGNPFTDPDNGGVIYASYIGYYNGYYFTGAARSLEREVTAYLTYTDWDFLIEGLTVDVEVFNAWPDALKICGCLSPDSNSKLFTIDQSSYDMCEGEGGTVWTFEDSYAKRALQLTAPADGATITANPSTCFNVPFALYWSQLCDAYTYDVQFALDEDFTLMLETVNDYTPLSLDAPNYLVAEGELSCEVTYYWRVRAAEDGTGQAIHSWWSEPWSFTVATEE